MFNRKQFIRMCCTGLFMLSVSIYSAFPAECSNEKLSVFPAVTVICICLTFISYFRWYFKFSVRFPNASFLENRFPMFRQGCPDINTLVFNNYKWLVIAIISGWLKPMSWLFHIPMTATGWAWLKLHIKYFLWQNTINEIFKEKNKDISFLN